MLQTTKQPARSTAKRFSRIPGLTVTTTLQRWVLIDGLLKLLIST